jgi:hypothetical protein
MKTAIFALCAFLLMQATPLLAAPSPPAAPKAETIDSVKAGMKDEMAKLKADQKQQGVKLRAQQKEQRDKLKSDQKQQVAKLKSDQKLRWQRFLAQVSINDTTKGSKTVSANP